MTFVPLRSRSTYLPKRNWVRFGTFQNLAICPVLESRRGGAMAEPIPLTNWLRAAAAGDEQAANRAYALVYGELRALAARQLGRAGAQATLTPTSLVNEAFVRLAGG